MPLIKTNHNIFVVFTLFTMQFIIALNGHRILGFVFSPYLIKREKNSEHYLTYDKLTLQKLPQYKEFLTPEQVQLVKYTENYNEQNLFKLFCKRKSTPHDFLNSMDEDILLNHVRPYIEKQIANCIAILQFNPEPIYYKHLQSKIYESDRIRIIDQECNTVFNFKKYEEGIKYQLTIEHQNKELLLTGKQGVIIAHTPCCLVLKNKLFIFNDIDGKKILPFFEKEYLLIPKQAEKKYFESFVKNSIAKYKVNAEGFRIDYIGASPKAVISLEKNLSGHLSLILRFIYNTNSIFFANRKTGMKVSCNYSEKEVVFTCVTRNYNEENAMVSRLLTLGLINNEGPYFEPHSKRGENTHIYGPITWLNLNKELLKNNGFEIAQKELDKDYYLGKVHLKFEVSDKDNDWFDIMAEVELEGFKIPFVEFKEHISNEIREFMLPNNKVMILPEEWFESYSDLMNFSQNEHSTLKLNKQHFSILNSKMGKMTDTFRDKLKSLISANPSEKENLPEGVNATLRNYQEDGYSWMYKLYDNGFGGCLADDMGLGKTLQTLTLLKRVCDENTNTKDASEEVKPEAPPAQLSLFESPNQNKNKRKGKTSLIIVPTSLVHNWINEAAKFTPSLNVSSYIGSLRGDLNKIIDESDVIITSYGIIRNDLEKFTKHEFLYLILDESQMIKNPGSKTYACVMQLLAENKLVLSGTPIENSLSDLWAQFNFINPGLLGSLNFFQSAFQMPIEKQDDTSKKEKLQHLIAPFILRRTKQEVAKELPELSEQVILCNMNEVQEEFYEREKSKARNLVLDNINSGGLKKASMKILQSLMRLRQIANHPMLVDEDYISGSGKFEEIKRNLDNLNNEGNKALLFSSFVGHLELVAEWMESKNIKYTILTGETRDREKVVEEFQDNEDCRFFLISLKAGGVGLNLTAASYVLMLDPWWNPAAEKQAINRAHRIGQDKHVMVYRFIAQNSLEEKILKLQAKKSQLADVFVNENMFKNISEEEILELFE